ncbi:Leucine--tRNA ligase [Labeo rohita]|uniref:Leucine--tRNA ligase n=1 Tax=Labeo rohita TaxID=84645 RepID=A0ABQ8M7A9_LABRO|nr:Leucine--tRNA ligase [Labeo rohita]
MYPEYNFGPLRVEFTTAQVIPYFSSKLHGIYDRANSTVCDQGVTHCRYKRTNQKHPHSRNAFGILPPSDSPPASAPQDQPLTQYNTVPFLIEHIYHVYSISD